MSPRTAGRPAVRLSVDRSRCEGHGLCQAVAPDLISVDEGYAELIDDGDVPVHRQAAAVSAARTCPIAALRVT
ncbi:MULTISPECIES: ferredoxin [unclassified Streptomyces]|uniref:ferredoxin n=1 Tax=unclassified Streptomyces TaxID=2593676 RepID=UPI00382759F0